MSDITVDSTTNQITVTEEVSQVIEVATGVASTGGTGVVSSAWVPDFVTSSTPSGFPVPINVTSSGVMDVSGERVYWFECVFGGTVASPELNFKTPGYVLGRMVNFDFFAEKQDGAGAGSVRWSRVAGDGQAFRGSGSYGVALLTGAIVVDGNKLAVRVASRVA